MASVQEPGNLALYIVAPSGARRLVKSAPVSWWAPGGSADGVPANTPEKWNFLPVSIDAGTAGYVLEFEYAAAGVDGIDASDCSMTIPAIVNGNAILIGNSAHTAGSQSEYFTVDLTFADIAATVAAQKVVIYRLLAKSSVQSFRIGGDRVFASIEDDTA